MMLTLVVLFALGTLTTTAMHVLKSFVTDYDQVL
jgi:hypothetical protein